ncbi:MAG: glucosamine-6-phosphate deaminase [Eubacterium sp.]|nr:glucosamine-6-phosphate deaminase [Eubacterium sp.]
MTYINAKNYETLSNRAADIISAQIVMFPNSVLGLATGSTPIGAYERLCELHKNGRLDFRSIKSVNLDEYVGLDPANDQSYRYFMDKHLFDRINIDKAKTNVPNGLATDIISECERYDCLIEEFGGIDLQLLGLGHNGHIGFNEPSDIFIKSTHCVDLTDETIDANTRFFNSRDEVPKKAITLGMGAIMAAKRILLIVNGQDKAEILKRAIFGPITPKIPASILQLHPALTVIAAI